MSEYKPRRLNREAVPGPATTEDEIRYSCAEIRQGIF